MYLTSSQYLKITISTYKCLKFLAYLEAVSCKVATFHALAQRKKLSKKGRKLSLLRLLLFFFNVNCWNYFSLNLKFRLKIVTVM